MSVPKSDLKKGDEEKDPVSLILGSPGFSNTGKDRSSQLGWEG